MMWRRGLGEQRGIYLTPCNAIHTFMMRFPIDVIFVGDDLEIVRVVWNVKPWRVVFGGPGTRGVVEVETGWLSRETVRRGVRASLRRR